MHRGELKHIIEYILVDLGSIIKLNHKVRIFSKLYAPIEF